MRIIDSQVHIWGAETPERPWRPGMHAQRAEPLGCEELITSMNEAGVDAAVLVPPSWEGERNDLAIQAHQKHPDRFAIMGRLNPEMPNARAALHALRDQPGLYGLRFTFRRPGLFDEIDKGSMDWVWGEAERSGLHMMVMVPQSHLSVLDGIAKRFPGLKLTIDHMGVLGATPVPERFIHFDNLVAMSRHPNVAVKVSALPCFGADAGDVYPYYSMHQYVRRLYDAFGPRRLFWGSDMSRLPGTYRECITVFTDEIPWLSDEDKDWIMGRALCEWLGWHVGERSL